MILPTAYLATTTHHCGVLCRRPLPGGGALEPEQRRLRHPPPPPPLLLRRPRPSSGRGRPGLQVRHPPAHKLPQRPRGKGRGRVQGGRVGLGQHHEREVHLVGEKEQD